MSDTASTYARLRAETASMLGLDSADLSKTEGLRLDITSLLLLEIDSLQGSILANEQIDLSRLSTALGMLQKMLPASALVAPASAADHRDLFAGAREELNNFLVKRANAIEAREQRESERLREANALLSEENSKLLARLRAAEQQQPAQQPTNVVPIDANATKPKHRPWRDYYESDGAA